VNYATPAAMSIFAIGSVGTPPGQVGGARTVAANRSFVAATVGC
jgi:hypothetical protein